MAMGRRILLMWIYEKRLQFPVNIKETNAKLAQDIMSQIGGL
jgi:spore coat protein JC